MTTRVATFPLRLPVSLKAALEKIAAMETENFFAERRGRADDEAFLRILNRAGGEPPRAEDTLA